MLESNTTIPSKTPWVLPYSTEKLGQIYTLGRQLGKGHFGTTYHCTHNSTGRTYACKSISKKKLLHKDDYDNVRREVQIMQHLSKSENFVKIHGIYEDLFSFHMVMELCEGGQLFDRIVQKGRYSERKAAKLIRNIVEGVQDCHSHGIMHRDLKPQNLVFDTVKRDATLKIIDFGLSTFYKPGETFSHVVGTPYYIAPEVLNEHYGPEADIWSAGVILYLLLSGVPPFSGETKEGIYKQISKGRLDLQSKPWPSMSDGAKDLLRKMLERNPEKRFTSHQVLSHPWIVDDRRRSYKKLRWKWFYCFL